MIGSVKELPVRDSTGTFHVDDTLLVADKAGVKDLTGTLALLLKALGYSQEARTIALAR
jgi:hypothetical protein